LHITETKPTHTNNTMSTSLLDQLKKKRGASIDKLVAAADKLDSNKKFGDDRIWKPAVDKAGNGYAVLRFLPAPQNEDVPWVRFWDHGFKGPTGRWYIEKSLTSIGQPDPVSDMNTQLWNSGVESDKEIVRERKRRLHYVSNVYIVQDNANPANNGKVMLFVYGKKIFDKIMEAMQPQFEDDKPLNPFDLWEGAEFKLKIRNVEGFRNYDRSEFATPGPLSSSDDEMEAIYKQVYSLAEFVDPKNFKSYEELEKKFFEVIGPAGRKFTGAETEALSNVKESASRPTKSAVAAPSADDDDLDYSTPAAKAKAGAAAATDDDEDSISYFAKLASED
jgi:hypothetical protein